jgi:hypothetical protein
LAEELDRDLFRGGLYVFLFILIISEDEQV